MARSRLALSEHRQMAKKKSGQEEERWEISLVVRPNMTEEIPLENTVLRKRGQGGSQARMSGAEVTIGWYEAGRTQRPSSRD